MSPGASSLPYAASTAPSASGMLPRCSGRQVPWAMRSPRALKRAVEKSIASLTTKLRAVRTTVSAISSAMDSSAFLTTSIVTGSRPRFTTARCAPSGFRRLGSPSAAPRKTISTPSDRDDEVVPAVADDLAARWDHRGGVVLFDDQRPPAGPVALDVGAADHGRVDPAGLWTEVGAARPWPAGGHAGRAHVEARRYAVEARHAAGDDPDVDDLDDLVGGAVAVGPLVGGAERLGERRGERGLGHRERHGQLGVLPEVAHVDEALELDRVAAIPLGGEGAAALGLERAEDDVDLGEIQGVEPALVRAHVVMLEVGEQQPQRAEEPGHRRDEDATDVERPRERGGVHRPVAPEGHQRELARIAPALAGHGADGARHRRVRDDVHAPRRVLQVDAERSCGDVRE